MKGPMKQEPKLFNQAPILAAIIAGIIAVTNSPDAFDFYDTIIGIILFLIVFSIKVNPENRPQRWALAGIYGLILILIFGAIFKTECLECRVDFIGKRIPGLTALVIWIILTCLSKIVLQRK